MSELKDYDIMDIESMDDESLKKSDRIQATRVYIKSDVDKVIAMKDKEIAKLKEQVALLQAEFIPEPGV